jgi:hypothetical protein
VRSGIRNLTLKLLAPTVCLAVYWYGLRSWFLGDDFLWLGIQARIHAGSSFWYEVFQPTQHGTFRPLSERLFFLVFHWAFGLNSLPYRICVFLTFFACLILLAVILRKITGSRMAGVAAALFWAVNPAMATVMTWSSSYMQVLCALFLLGAFYFLLRHIETGNWRWYAAQVAAFLAGFLVMETNAVYPVLALGYTYFFARKYFRRELPLLLVSIAFVLLDITLVPKQTSGYYALHLDWRMADVFRTYWRSAVWPPEAAAVLHVPWWIVPAGVRLVTLPLGAFLIWETVRKRFLAGLLLSWYVLLLAPVLPLGGHVLYYYLSLPLMGLAAFGGYAFWRGWESGGWWRKGAAAVAGAFVLVSIPVAWRATRERWQWSQDARTLVMRVAEVSRANPGKVILLAGVGDDTFQRVVQYRPFALAGAGEVYLVPEARGRITPVADTNWEDAILPAAPTREELEQRRFVVLAADQGLRNITENWSQTALARPVETPRRIDVASEFAAPLLGEGWYASEGNHRWMGQRATLRLGAPAQDGGKLKLTGGCAAEETRQGPLHIRVSVDGTALPAVSVAACGDEWFELEFPLPPGLAGRSAMEITIETDRAYRPPRDSRELGLAFGTFEVRKD